MATLRKTGGRKPLATGRPFAFRTGPHIIRIALANEAEGPGYALLLSADEVRAILPDLQALAASSY